METLELVLKYVVAPLLPVLGMAAVASLGALAKLLHERGKASKAARVAAVFADLAHGVVAKVEVEFRPFVKNALADGKVTPEEGAELRDKAFALTMAAAPPYLKAAAGEIFGAAGLDVWISGLIEKAHGALPESPKAEPVALVPSPA